MRPLCRYIKGLKLNRSLILYTVVTAFVVGVDQLTKWLAVTFLMPAGDFPLIKGVIHLTYVENTGAAFGILKDHRWVFMTASWISIVCMYLFLAFYNRVTPLMGISAAFIIGGGIGNMIDRIAYGYVVDFINFELINFAVFNAADSFVCVGAFIIFLYVIFIEIKGSAKKTPEPDANGT